MRTGFAALLWALAMMIPAAADDQTVPCQVVNPEQKPCPADPQAQARWARKRLRELDEQAETARLNRQRDNTPVPVSTPAPPVAAPPRQAANVSPSPAQYHSALEEYQALREAYDRQLRAYYRAFPAQAAVHAPLPASNTAPTQAELAGQDAARADAWHGYNGQNGSGNGY